MDNYEWMRKFREVGGIKEGHFRGNSGRHMSRYLQKDAILSLPHLAKDICREFANVFQYSSVDAVIAPAFGAIILSAYTADILSQINKTVVLSLYAEKDGYGNISIRDGFKDFIKNKRILVLEDTLTTGGSVKRVVDLVKTLGGIVVGVGAIFNRGNVNPGDLGGIDDLFCLCNLSNDPNFVTWEQSECPLCKESVDININIGHGGKV